MVVQANTAVRDFDTFRRQQVGLLGRFARDEHTRLAVRSNNTVASAAGLVIVMQQDVANPTSGLAIAERVGQQAVGCNLTGRNERQ